MQHKSVHYILVYTILCDVIVFPRKHEKRSETGMAIPFEEPISELRTFAPMTASPNLPRGPYFGFLTNICKTLISNKYSVKYLNKYFLILRKGLKDLGINFLQEIWIKRLRKRLKKYSIYNKNKLKSKVNDFLVFITDGKPKKNEYFKAMNAIYTSVDDLRMDDYIFFLREYGKGALRHIGKKTRQAFEQIVFGRYHRQPEDEQGNIELKFTSAVVEYWEERLNGTAYNFTLGHMFKNTLDQP